MTITFELNSEAGSELLAQAQACGLSLEDFAKRVLEERGLRMRAAEPSAEQRIHAFEEFIANFESPAVLPEEAFQRENWYPGR